MILTTQRYRAERGKNAETWQGFDVTVEIEQARRYMQIELHHLTRWRSVDEYQDYLKWVIRELDGLKKDMACLPAKK